MTNPTTVWYLPDSYPIDNDFFRPHEKKQLQNAYRNFLMNTKYHPLNSNDSSDDEEDAHMLLQSKIQLFQLFIRTQPVNIRNFR